MVIVGVLEGFMTVEHHAILAVPIVLHVQDHHLVLTVFQDII